MITVEARTIEQVRNFATLMSNVCNMAEANQKAQNKTALIIGYWKAKAMKKGKLVEVMERELINGSNTHVYRSLEDLVEDHRTGGRVLPELGGRADSFSRARKMTRREQGA